MARDFSTDPEYAAKLDWARAFVREEIWPLETVFGELEQAEIDAIYRPLQERVKAHGLWVARGARFYDGPDEVHRQSVARQILRDYTPPPGEVPTEHLPTRRAAARENFAALLEAITAND